MKRVIYSLIVAILCFGCTEKIEQTGSIYGVITDKATGEPVRSAGVQLNTGTKTITGSEGQYEFAELKAGEYTLLVTKTGYTDLVDYKINIEAGKTVKGDVQIEKLPAALRIVNDKGENIDELDFGSEASVVSRSFNIFNDSPETLEWIITKNCDWITEISRTTGTLQAGKQQPVVITIDRKKLSAGNNSYILNIASDNGTKELTIKATGNSLPTLNTLNITDIMETTAVFNGEVLTNGIPSYTERGFVYSTSSMPTIETTIAKPTALITGNSNYSATVTGLTVGVTYYVRAYATNALGTAYSTNEVAFVPVALPFVILQEVDIMVQKTDFIPTSGEHGGEYYYSSWLWCYNSTVGGFTDWRLPTLTELMAIYNNRIAIGGFNTTSYWTDEECYVYRFQLNFNNGNSTCNNPHEFARARCVRYLP